ncbi:MAG: zinc ribbon domain-containing protein [Pedosphaera sp.]|nr:zinc ribbon domain-containing protein [Pedosphaera sp.]
MPTYDYSCLKCGHSFEVVQSMKDPPLKKCPRGSCKLKAWGKGPVKRGVGGGAGLIFKGSGFYITDYRSEGYKAAAKQDSNASSAGAGDSKAAVKTESKSETKPQASPESKPQASSESKLAAKGETKPAKKD